MGKLATALLEGVAPYSQSRYHNTPKLNKELPNDYEERTWKEKLHVTDEGMVVMPPLAFKNCIAEIAKFLGVQIPGKGKSTYTKHFEAGVLVVDEVPIEIRKVDEVKVDEEVYVGLHKDDVPGKWMHVPADGVSGSGKRVLKCFPFIKPGWKALVTFYIYDETITRDVFLYHLKQAGSLIGVGTFRVRNKGTYGRFKVLSLKWEDLLEDDLV